MRATVEKVAKKTHERSDRKNILYVRQNYLSSNDNRMIAPHNNQVENNHSRIK